MKIFSYVVVVFIFALTGFTILPDSKFLMLGGSVADSAIFISSKKESVIILAALCLIFIYLYLVKKKQIFFYSYITIFFLWFLSGRTICLNYYPDGRIIVGWFNFSVNEYKLCNSNQDCETIIAQKTKFIYTNCYTIYIENENINKNIFLGPFIWNQFKNKHIPIARSSKSSNKN